MNTVLPIDTVVPEVVGALGECPAVIVIAPPGSGKTTRLPPALLDAGLAGGDRVLVLQPRRVAVRLAARRIAEERGTALGTEVGYQIRFERRCNAHTRLIVLTEGLLIRRLQDDPMLDGVGLVVLDEFHERSLHLDLGLALLREIQLELRPELRLVIMSATLDPGPLVDFFGEDCRVVRASGHCFPVELAHQPRSDPRRLPIRCAAAIRTLFARHSSGHLLAFLPGVREIDTCQRLLADMDALVLPLHGRLPSRAQDLALAPSSKRKIVLATNIAETSVTLEGVTAVVDSGLARVPFFDPVIDLDRLELRPISRASADQRSGRAGRTGPGTCLRLWTLAQDRLRPPTQSPAVQRSDLLWALLQIFNWGIDPAEFGWFEAPPASALAHARAALQRLGAVDGSGITPRGRSLATLPVHPRQALCLMAGHPLGCTRTVAGLLALTSEADPWAGQPMRTPDLMGRIRALDQPPSRVHRGRMSRVRKVRDQLDRITTQQLGPPPAHGRDDPQLLARAMLAGFPERVAQRRSPTGHRYRLASGRGAALKPNSDVEGHELLLVLELTAGARGPRSEHRIGQALPIDADWLTTTFHSEVRFDPERAAVVSRRQERYLTLLLSDHPSDTPPDPTTAAALLAQAASRQPEQALRHTAESRALLARLEFLARHMPELDLPPCSPPDVLLGEICPGRRSFADLRALDLTTVLTNRLSWKQRQALETHAPERIQIPSGAHIRLRYDNDPPVLAARIQQLFGMRELPRLARGRVALMLHLLAPNNRTVQVTQDLASFWQTTYHDVRRDLRGRYPKHSWPEDPSTARAENRPRRKR